MNTKYSRVFTTITAMLLSLAMMISLSACKKETTEQVPTDNDEEGWFSVEVLNEYNVAGLVQPSDTEVTSKPERNTLYLKGDESTFKTATLYIYESINIANDNVYLPVISVGEDGVAEVSGLQEITDYDGTELYPDGEETSVTFIYKSVKRILECAITLEKTGDTGEDQVCISFADRTDVYGDLA